MMNIIFYWENTNFNFYERRELSSNYLHRFLNKIDLFDSALQYLEILQEKMEMGFVIYDNLLKELLKKMETNRTKCISDSNEFILLKIYIEEPVCKEKFENGNMKEFVKWLYC